MSATSTELSDETSFPYFFCTVPPDGQQASAMAALIKGYGTNMLNIKNTNILSSELSDTFGKGGLDARSLPHRIRMVEEVRYLIF